MRGRIRIAHTTRTDGNGKPIKGYYVTDCGIPVGCAHATKAAAMVTLRAYVADIYRLIAGVSA